MNILILSKDYCPIKEAEMFFDWLENKVKTRHKLTNEQTENIIEKFNLLANGEKEDND